MDFDDLDICKTPHTVSALLKLYFRELPEPVLTYELYDCFIAANGIVIPEARLECVKKILAMMPAPNMNLLVYLVRFLHLVAQYANVNKMNAANLAMVFAPNLLRPHEENFSHSIADTPHASHILESLIHDFDFFFKDFVPLPYDPEVEVEDDGPGSPVTELASPSPTEEGHPAVPRRRPRRAGNIKNMTTHFRQLNVRLKQTLNKSSGNDDGGGIDSTSTGMNWDEISAHVSDQQLKSFGPRENPFLKKGDENVGDASSTGDRVL